MTAGRKRQLKTRSEPVHAPKRIDWLPMLAVAVVAIAACIVGLSNGFTQDDISIIRDSPRLQGLSAWREILTLPYWPPPASPDLYRPVTSLLLLAQYVVGDGAPIVFRIFSYALYAAASVSVYRLARRLSAPPIALGVALLFAAHPLHVEAVVLAVAQNELLVALIATLMVVRYIDRRRAASGALQTTDWGLLAALYLVAGFAKEQGLLLPAFLLLAELFLVSGPALRGRVRDLWKGYAVLGATGALVIAARTAVLGGRVSASIAADALRGLGLGGRALTMLQIVPQWFRLLAWPAHLRAEYSPGEFVASTAFGLPEAFGLVLVIGAIVAVWFARRRAPALAFGIAWTAIALLPVSNVLVPTGILLADRTLFLPSVGFVLALGGLVAWLIDRPPLVSPVWRRGLAIASALLVIAGVARSATRQRIWRDPETLTLASLVDAPRSWRVQQAYGDILFDRGQPADAILAFRDAITYAPESWRPRNRLAQHLRLLGDEANALVELRLSLAENPGRIETVVQLPPVLISLGKYDEAEHLADSIVVADDAPPIMVQFARLADSARTANAAPGSVRVGLFRSP